MRLGDIKYLILMLEIDHNSHSEGTRVLLEILSIGLHIATFEAHLYVFSQAMLNIEVYQMLIVANVPVNSDAL